jgi:hypothetical protein
MTKEWTEGRGKRAERNGVYLEVTPPFNFWGAGASAVSGLSAGTRKQAAILL